MGLCLSTWLCQAICHEWIDAKVNSNEHLRSVRRVLSTKQAYKLVLLTRLTPIPFGLQNAVFAVCPFSACCLILNKHKHCTILLPADTTRMGQVHCVLGGRAPSNPGVKYVHWVDTEQYRGGHIWRGHGSYHVHGIRRAVRRRRSAHGYVTLSRCVDNGARGIHTRTRPRGGLQLQYCTRRGRNYTWPRARCCSKTRKPTIRQFSREPAVALAAGSIFLFNLKGASPIFAHRDPRHHPLSLPSVMTVCNPRQSDRTSNSHH